MGGSITTTVREMPLLDAPPWIRTLGKLTIDVTTQGWRFPSPDDVRGEGREARDEQSSPRAPRPSPLSSIWTRRSYAWKRRNGPEPRKL